MHCEQADRALEVLSTIESTSIPVPTALIMTANGIGPNVQDAAQRDAIDGPKMPRPIWVDELLDLVHDDSSDGETDDDHTDEEDSLEPPNTDRRYCAFHGVETHEPTLQEVGDAESSLFSEPLDCRLQNLWWCIKKAGDVDF
jgi:hypothetical protein